MGAKPVTVISPSFTKATEANEPLWFTSAAILAVDFIALSAIYWLAVWARAGIAPASMSFYSELFAGILIFLAAFKTQGLYPGLLLHPAEEIRRVFYCITTVFLLSACAALLWHTPHSYSRSIFLVAWGACTPIVLIARHLARHLLVRSPWWGVSAVVLGSGTSARRVAQTLSDRKLGVRVKGVFTDLPVNSWPSHLPPILGSLQAAPYVASSGFAQYAILSLPQKSPLELRRTIQDCCEGFHHILLVPDMPGVCSIGIGAREIGGEVGFELSQRLFHKSAALTKRALDLVSGLAILIALFPILLILMAAIKLTSKGPIFFGHTRFGRNGKTFLAWKFRTMVQDSDAALKEYLAQNPHHMEEWNKDHKLKNDPRVTKVGKWLRRYSIDELPQLFNVVAGQMSLVGPRPIVSAEIPKYGRGYGLYTRVLPGITGLWQVSGRNNTTYEERVAFDEYYVGNWSIWLDTYILVRTLKVVLTADGAY